MPSTTSWNDSSIFSRQVISAPNGSPSLCNFVSVMSRPSLDVPHWASMYCRRSWRRVIPFGNPCLVSYRQWVQQLKGAAFWPLGTPPQKQQEVSCTRSFKSLHSHHRCGKRSFSALHSAASTGKIHLNNAPSRDVLIAVRSRKLWFASALIHKLAWPHHRQTPYPEVLHPFWKGNGPTFANVLLPPTTL